MRSTEHYDECPGHLLREGRLACAAIAHPATAVADRASSKGAVPVPGWFENLEAASGVLSAA